MECISKKTDDYCKIKDIHAPKAWCETVCKGTWKKGDPVNPSETQIRPIDPSASMPSQSPIKNQLSLRDYASEAYGALKRAVVEKFAMVDEKVYAERMVCCSTCGGVQRCPYCGCLLKAKDKLESEKGCPNPETYPQLKKYPPRNYWEVCGQLTTAIVIGRNERADWFNKTIDSLFATATGRLEVIAILDGYDSDIIKPEPGRGDIKVIINNPAIGRRKGINAAVKQALGDYIFIIDAHCRMNEGWDTRLKCACDEKTIAVSTLKAMMEDFENELRGHYGFVYLNPDCIEKWHPTKSLSTGPLIEPMMGFTGCAWMIRKTDYEKLGGYDEELGEYGYDGPEWALKIQLETNGRVVLRKDVTCWHIFGTNKEAKNFLPSTVTPGEFKNAMASKYHDRIGWLAAGFMPLPEWDQKAIVYGSGGPSIVCCLSRLGDEKVIKTCIEHLKNMPIDKRIVFVSRKDDQQPCHKTYYEQLIKGIEETEDARFIYIAEHDVLYHPSHFAFRPPRDDTFYFDLNVVWLNREGFIKQSPGQLLSMLVAERELLTKWLAHRIKHIKEGGRIDKMEPTVGDFVADWVLTYPPGDGSRTKKRTTPYVEPKGPKYYVEDFKADEPSVDIRHGGNWTGDRDGEYYEILEPWGRAVDLWNELTA